MKCENCSTEMQTPYGSGRFCGASCARSFSTKLKRAEISERVRKSLSGRIGWSRGKTFSKKHSLICKKCGSDFLAAHPRKRFCDLHPNGVEICVLKSSSVDSVFIEENHGKKSVLRKSCKRKLTEEQRKKLSEAMKKRIAENPHLFMNGNRGKVRQIEIDGIRLHGSWELKFYIWAKRIGLEIQRAPRGFPYIWNGERTYFPDFYLPSHDIYVEIKGYEKERDRAKWSQFPERLLVLRKRQMSEIEKGAIQSFESLLSVC